jgi:hypothetical protein
MPKRLQRHAFNQPHLSVGSRRLLQFQFIRQSFYMSEPDLATPRINGVGPRDTHTHTQHDQGTVAQPIAAITR